MNPNKETENDSDPDEDVTIGKFVEKMKKVNEEYFDLQTLLRLGLGIDEAEKIAEKAEKKAEKSERKVHQLQRQQTQRDSLYKASSRNNFDVENS